jgi:hypothetical protein
VRSKSRTGDDRARFNRLSKGWQLVCPFLATPSVVMNCDDAAAGFSYGPGAERSTPTTRPKCTSAALIYTLFIVIFVAAIRLRLIAMVEKGQRRNCKDQKIARCDRAPIEGMTLRGFVLILFKTTAMSVALKAAVLPVWYDLEALLVWFGRCLTDLPKFDQWAWVVERLTLSIVAARRRPP